MKKLLLTTAIFLGLSILNAQSPFSKTIEGVQYFSSSELLADGSLLVITYNSTPISTIHKLDPVGNLIWAKSYDFQLEDVLELADGRIAFNGNKVDAMTMNNTNYYGVLNANGDFEWKREFSSPSIFSNYDLGSITKLTGNKLLFSYSKYNKTVFAKCGEYGEEEECGEEEDTTTYGKNPEFDSEGYEYGGYVSACKAESRMALVRHDVNGDVVWAKTFGDDFSNYTHLKELVALPNGEFLGLGMTTMSDGYNDGLVIKFDINGNILFANTYDFGYVGSYFSSTFRNAIVKNGFIYASGMIYEYNETTLIWSTNNILVKMDMEGNVVSGYKMIGNNNLMANISFSIFDQNLTNEYYIYNTYDAAGQVIINKVKYEETMGCNVVPFNIVATEFGAFASVSGNVSGIRFNALTPSSATLTSTVVNPVVTEACASIASIEDELNLSLTTFPNPTTDLVTINGLNIESTYSIQLIDVNGKVVLAQNGIEGVNMTTINVASLASGSYFINVTDVNLNASEKLKLMKN